MMKNCGTYGASGRKSKTVNLSVNNTTKLSRNFALLFDYIEYFVKRTPQFPVRPLLNSAKKQKINSNSTPQIFYQLNEVSRHLSGDFYQLNEVSGHLSGDFYQLNEISRHLSGDFYRLNEVSRHLSGDFYQLNEVGRHLSGDFYQLNEVGRHLSGDFHRFNEIKLNLIT